MLSTLASDAGESWSVRPPRPPRASFRGTARVAVAIVGGGLTGLSAALHLKLLDPSLSVTLVEAGLVASGASGKGTGLLGPRVGPNLVRARERYGDRQARAMYAASERAVDETLELIDTLAIECGLEVSGQIVAARTERDVAPLRAQAEAYRALGFDVPLLERRDLVGLPAGEYQAALLHRRAATLEPLLLTVALATRAEALGVTIHERSRVLELRSGRHPALRLAEGQLTAEHVVLATNAYELPSKRTKSAIVPLEVHALATDPLAPEVAEQLDWHSRRAVIEWGVLAPYYRLTVDNRVVFGGGALQYPLSGPAYVRARARERTWALQERWLRALHPALRSVAVRHRWSGHIALTRDGLPIAGPRGRERGVWQAGGWCGHGLALSIRTGRELASCLLADSAAELSLPWWRSDAPEVPQNALARPVLGGALRMVGWRASQLHSRAAVRAEHNSFESTGAGAGTEQWLRNKRDRTRVAAVEEAGQC